MARILLIEDEADLRRVLTLKIEGAGHRVEATPLGREGLRRAAEEPPDLILLDLMLPDLQGQEVCRRIKADPRTRSIPVVMLTARGEEIDRVVGLEIGAEDYLVKPFSVRELLLRIGKILDRARPPSGGLGEEIEFGRLKVSPAAHRVWVDAREVPLTALEFRLLLSLLHRKGRALDRTSLLDEVWGVTAEVTARSVDVHVTHLREKLGPAGGYIETVRGVGYRFLEAPRKAPR